MYVELPDISFAEDDKVNPIHPHVITWSYQVPQEQDNGH